ncbi:MAG: 50S ribosomal protein L9 [Chlorobi bacterium]|nr:50S ribosomal protein L9 [Chlorobiota bacterium]
MPTTKIILRQDYENLGEIGDVVEVKSGYARNFLIPRGIAYRATDGALRAVEAGKRTREAKQSRLEDEARVIAEKLESVSITIPMRVGEEDRLFGSVTTPMIVDELAKQGHRIDRRSIQIDEPIKTLGMFDVPVQLHKNVTTSIKVFVVAEEGAEAE